MYIYMYNFLQKGNNFKEEEIKRIIYLRNQQLQRIRYNNQLIYNQKLKEQEKQENQEKKEQEIKKKIPNIQLINIFNCYENDVLTLGDLFNSYKVTSN